VAASGLPYTIIKPPLLTNEPARQFQLHLGEPLPAVGICTVQPQILNLLLRQHNANHSGTLV
jgi:hypothetical protein